MAAAMVRWLLTAGILLLASILTPSSGPVDDGWAVIEVPRDAQSEALEREVALEVERNIQRLAATGALPQQATAVAFQWPLRPAASLTDYGYHGVSGFMDHNPAIGALLDYTCGDRTYDLASGYNHGGSDFFTYPFGWLKMDRDEVEVVAAADGVIVYRHDGEYDRQCAMTGAASNQIILRHADGTRSRYLHMKKWSLTPKGVGDAVVAGEYLGIVGSSGSSTGPHLHFEVENASYQDIDPYNGPCNPSASLWAAQPPYYDSAILAVTTGSARPVFPSCPEPEIPNIKTEFEVDDVVYFVTYYRDQLAGQESVYRVYRPDGTIWQQWTGASTRDHYSASYWYRAYDLGPTAPNGTWRFEVTFEGETYRTTFTVGDPGTITVTYPNGGEILPLGAPSWLFWQDDIDGDVRIDLLADDAFHSTIVTATASDGRHFWLAPSDLDPASAYKIRISSALNAGISDESDTAFSFDGLPRADFLAAPTLGPAPLSVVFTDTSGGLVASWLWDFGDGITTTEQHPAHLYADPGTYTVALGVEGPYGTDAITRTDLISVTVPPVVAAFGNSRPVGMPPLTVTFTNLTTGPATWWAWDFGDGVTTTLEHPVHVYPQLGIYTVTLTAGNAEEIDVLVRPRLVWAVDNFVYLPLVLR